MWYSGSLIFFSLFFFGELRGESFISSQWETVRLLKRLFFPLIELWTPEELSSGKVDRYGIVINFFKMLYCNCVTVSACMWWMSVALLMPVKVTEILWGDKHIGNCISSKWYRNITAFHKPLETVPSSQRNRFKKFFFYCYFFILFFIIRKRSIVFSSGIYCI